MQTKLKGVLNSHRSVPIILPNDPTRLPPFSTFVNFHPNLSNSCSSFIIRLEQSQYCNYNRHSVVISTLCSKEVTVVVALTAQL